LDKKDNIDCTVDEDSTEEILALYKLSNCIESTFHDGTKNSFVIAELISLYTYVTEAIELLARYDNADNDDVKFDLGMEYSELIADIEDIIREVAEQGICLYIH